VEGAETDVLIRPEDFNTALHGDVVRIKIKNEGSRRLQGMVDEVLQRKRTEFIGHLEMNKNFAFFVAEMDKPIPDIYIPLSNINHAKDNDRVVVRLLEWEKGKRPLGEVVNI